ncbi:hypothetical protein DOTSEDRAFT_22694 [Dothistroma septosporum NZE10]|uniref:Uncharacterized protein n=1 Tax=Dothistroma septosporum (strain NZE10 / CBS 128990) TaxID=675120 RepID=N1PUN0_DOTSN|nr:hypothetical protein DOTSEDRAFT_22694 [Dothistroma septosporum NZE10]
MVARHPSLPRAESRRPHQYLPITRDAQPDAFRSLEDQVDIGGSFSEHCTILSHKQESDNDSRDSATPQEIEAAHILVEMAKFEAGSLAGPEKVKPDSMAERIKQEMWQIPISSWEGLLQDDFDHCNFVIDDDPNDGDFSPSLPVIKKPRSIKSKAHQKASPSVSKGSSKEKKRLLSEAEKQENRRMQQKNRRAGDGTGRAAAIPLSIEANAYLRVLVADMAMSWDARVILFNRRFGHEHVRKKTALTGRVRYMKRKGEW